MFVCLCSVAFSVLNGFNCILNYAAFQLPIIIFLLHQSSYNYGRISASTSGLKKIIWVVLFSVYSTKAGQQISSSRKFKGQHENHKTSKPKMANPD
jgi:hypothetical protein